MKIQSFLMTDWICETKEKNSEVSSLSNNVITIEKKNQNILGVELEWAGARDNVKIQI